MSIQKAIELIAEAKYAADEAVGQLARKVGELEGKKILLEKEIKALQTTKKNLDAAVKIKTEWCKKNGIIICE